MVKAINGTFGRLWCNDEDYNTVKQFEAKAKLNWDEVPLPEQLAPEYNYLGYTIEGTITGTKVDSRFIELYAEGIQTGNIPDVTLVGRLNDPKKHGYERVAIYGVVFDELAIMQFEANTTVEEEVPFKATSYKFLDKLSA